MTIKQVKKKKNNMLLCNKNYLIFRVYSFNKKSVNSIFLKLRMLPFCKLFMRKNFRLYLFIEFDIDLYYKNFIIQYLVKENIYFNLVSVKLKNNFLGISLFKNFKKINDNFYVYKFLLIFVYNLLIYNTINYIKFLFTFNHVIYLNFNMMFLTFCANY